MRRQQTTGCDPMHHLRPHASLRLQTRPALSSPMRRVRWNCASCRPSHGRRPGFRIVFSFIPGALIVSSSTYAGTADTVTVGQTLPGGGTAIANGTYPNVFENATVDGSFGVTSPLILGQYVLHGHDRSAFLINDPERDRPDRHRHQLQLQVRNRRSTIVDDEKRFDLYGLQGADQHARRLEFQYALPCRSEQSGCCELSAAIVEIDGDRSTRVTPVNTYSGNNRRAAILNDSYGQKIYYTAGNAGNGSGTPPVFIVTTRVCRSPDRTSQTRLSSASSKARRARRMDFNTDIR